MKILDRYITKPIIFSFLGCLAVFISLYVISDILSKLDEILKNHANLLFLSQYYLANFPRIFTETSPIAMLLSTIYTFGRFNHDNELIAMRASGLSLWQISFPVFIIGLILSIAVFFVNEKFIPEAASKSEKMRLAIEGKDKDSGARGQIIHNLTFYGLGNKLFFINSFSAKTAAMEGINILEHDNHQNLTAKVFAKQGTYRENRWVFYEFTRYNYDDQGQILGDAVYSPEQTMDIAETPQDFLLQRKRPEFMNIAQLEDYIWRLKRSGAKGALRNLLVEFYQRYAVSFSSIVLILIGLPFSFASRRKSNLFSSFGICLSISFLYYIFTAISLALGKNGALFPLLATWLIPISFSLIAINKINKSL